MKYGLIDFQKDAVTELLKKMESMRRSYDADGSLSAVSLTAPTGAGKTVISAAVAEVLVQEMIKGQVIMPIKLFIALLLMDRMESISQCLA